MTEFEPWYPLADGGSHAPASPGVFQVRLAAGLVDYPTGKSAMIHYAAADDLRTAVRAFAAANPSAAWLCRHQVAIERDALLTRLLARFATRFGSTPRRDLG